MSRDDERSDATSPTTCAPRSSTPRASWSRSTPATSGRRNRRSPISSRCRRELIALAVGPLGTIERPPRQAFTARERRLIARLRTPLDGPALSERAALQQRAGAGRATLRSFRGVVRHGCAHCLEAALFAAVVLEQHGYPPLVLSFESIDELDHVIFVYRRGGRWGSVARSRDPGPARPQAGVRHAARAGASYVDPYVDYTGRVTGYAVVDLRVMGDYDWRLAETNVWKVERMLLDYPHRRIATSDARIERLRARYRAYRAEHGRKPVVYEHRDAGRAAAEFRTTSAVGERVSLVRSEHRAHAELR